MLAAGVLALTLALGELSLDQNMRVVTDLGLASISIFAVVIAIFLGSSLLYKEIERKTLYVILPKPIARFEFLLGKYFGIVATCVVFIAIMGALAASRDCDSGGSLDHARRRRSCCVLACRHWASRFFFAKDRTVVLPIWSVVALGASVWLCSTVDVELFRLLASLVLNVGEVS